MQAQQASIPENEIKIIGDTVEIYGAVVARIVAKTGTVRDRFEAHLLGTSNATARAFAVRLRNEVKAKEQAKTILVDELEDIIDKLLGE